MAKSQNSFIKKQKEKARLEKRASKLERKHNKKNLGSDSSIHDMSKLEMPEGMPYAKENNPSTDAKDAHFDAS